jgi:hypothetical protein
MTTPAQSTSIQAISTGNLSTATAARLAQLKAASPARHLNQAPAPPRVSPRISDVPETVTLTRVNVIIDAESWCTSVINWLQAVVNWINPILSWFQNVLPWLNAIAWFLDLIGVGEWLSAVVSWLSEWISNLQGWVSDIQSVINWCRENGCGATWVQDFINEVEQLENDLVGAYNWLVSAINWIESLF